MFVVTCFTHGQALFVIRKILLHAFANIMFLAFSFCKGKLLSKQLVIVLRSVIAYTVYQVYFLLSLLQFVTANIVYQFYPLLLQCINTPLVIIHGINEITLFSFILFMITNPNSF